MKIKTFGVTLLFFVNVTALLAFKLVDGAVTDWAVTGVLILDALVAAIWIVKIK